MKKNIWKRLGEYKCWLCHIWVSNNELENADGFCPHCDSEINIKEAPYEEE